LSLVNINTVILKGSSDYYIW